MNPPGAKEAPIGRDDFAASFFRLADAQGTADATFRILLAVSGGPDSAALMHAAAEWGRERPGTELTVATVDHRLRPVSGTEAEAVGIAARALGLDHRILTWARNRDGPVSQEAARRARYRLLCEAAAELGAGALVTAHTQDDQAETLLIRMAAGSGLAGLAGMRPVTRWDGLAHHRPFLVFPKSRLVVTCRREGWAFVDDPSNADRRFARARWRRLMPALASEGLDAARLARLADRMRRADAALDAAVAGALARCRMEPVGGAVTLGFRALAAEPTEIALRALGRALAVPEGSIQLRLERLETCLSALLEAAAEARPTRRTLAGRMLALDRAGTLTIAPEPRRSRGRATTLTVPAARTPHSLGIQGTRA